MLKTVISRLLPSPVRTLADPLSRRVLAGNRCPGVCLQGTRSARTQSELGADLTEGSRRASVKYNEKLHLWALEKNPQFLLNYVTC
jgi:hypothetical protein